MRHLTSFLALLISIVSISVFSIFYLSCSEEEQPKGACIRQLTPMDDPSCSNDETKSECLDYFGREWHEGKTCADLGYGGGCTNSNPEVKYTIGGTVSGLSGTLILKNNNYYQVTITSNGYFIFQNTFSNCSNYSVTVTSKPSNQVCTITNGSGTLNNANVTNIQVVCERAYSVGGTVNGLNGTIILQNNGTDNLTIISNGSFVFPKQLGNGDSYSVSSVATQCSTECSVSSGSGIINGTDKSNIIVTCTNITCSSPTVLISASQNVHSMALKNDNTVWSWGDNYSGQLGDGTTTTRYTPVQVSSLTGITAISAGNSHSIALKNEGTVWSWGANTSGQLGDGTTTTRHTPVQISSLTGITAISAGNSHSIALKNDGTVWSWGSNSYGQLGIGLSIWPFIKSSPVGVPGI
ncbi:MAG: hypothetical protein V1874_14340 [Spirochaetota bacterium]